MRAPYGAAAGPTACSRDNVARWRAASARAARARLSWLPPLRARHDPTIGRRFRETYPHRVASLRNPLRHELLGMRQIHFEDQGAIAEEIEQAVRIHGGLRAQRAAGRAVVPPVVLHPPAAARPARPAQAPRPSAPGCRSNTAARA